MCLALCHHSPRERAVIALSPKFPGPAPVKKESIRPMDQKQIIKQLDETLLVRYGCSMDTASPQQVYRALCYVVNRMLASKSAEFYRKNEGKQVYYMSMEFLVGTSLRNNLYNLGLEDVFT